MIQYYHFHNKERRYIDIISDNSENKSEYLSVFTIIANFQKSNGSCFTYVPYKEKAYFVQTNSVNEEFVHGLVGNLSELKDEPTRYIGHLNYEYKEDSETTISEINLPNGSDFDLATSKNIHPYIAEVIEHLMYTNDLCIINAKDEKILIQFIKTLYKLLPLNYVKHIGFSVAPSSLPSLLWDKQNKIKEKIRIVATTSECNSVDGVYICDLNNVYKKCENLHSYSSIIDYYGKDLSDLRVLSFINSVKDCFLEDGSYNKDLIDSKYIEKNFELHQDYDSAMNILKFADKYKFSVETISEVIIYLIENNHITEESMKLINEARKNEKVSNLTNKAYGEILFENLLNGHLYQKDEKNCIANYICNIINDELTSLEKKIDNAPDTSIKEIFDVLAYAYFLSKDNQILKLMINCVDIDKTFNFDYVEKKESSQIDNIVDSFSKELFEISNNYPDVKTMIIASIIATCYKDFNDEKNKYRFKSLGLYINEVTDSIIDSIKLLLDIKSKLTICMDIINLDQGIEGFNFLPQEWLNKISNHLSFSNCLNLVMSEDFSNEQNGDFELMEMVTNRLTNLQDVKDNVNYENNLFQYKQFMSKYPELPFMENNIKSYIDSIDQNKQVFDNFLNYRYDYLIKSYQTMSYNRKIKKVSKRIEEARRKGELSTGYTIKKDKDEIYELLLSKDEKLRLDRQVVAEKIMDELVNNRKIEKSANNATNNGKYFLYSSILTLLFIIISTVILIAPQAIVAFLLKEDIYSRIMLNFKFYHIIAILYTGILYMVTYIKFWVISNHDRKASLKRANLVTLFFAIFPISAYQISFMLCYFLIKF